VAGTRKDRTPQAMKISITRFTVVLVLAIHWLAVAMLIRISFGMEKVFLDFNVELPVMTSLALQLTKPLLIAPVATIMALGVVASEVLLKSGRARFAVQMVDLCFWLIFAGFCTLVIQTPLLNLIEKLEH
jgi:hypothetical protein